MKNVVYIVAAWSIVIARVAVGQQEISSDELERQEREADIMPNLAPCIDVCDFDDPECVRSCGMGRGLDFEDFLVQEVGERMLLQKLEQAEKAVSEYKKQRKELPSAAEFWRRRRAGK